MRCFWIIPHWLSSTRGRCKNPHHGQFCSIQFQFIREASSWACSISNLLMPWRSSPYLIQFFILCNMNGFEQGTSCNSNKNHAPTSLDKYRVTKSFLPWGSVQGSVIIPGLIQWCHPTTQRRELWHHSFFFPLHTCQKCWATMEGTHTTLWYTSSYTSLMPWGTVTESAGIPQGEPISAWPLLSLPATPNKFCLNSHNPAVLHYHIF